MTKLLLGGAAVAALVAIAPAAAQNAPVPAVQRPPAVQVHSRAQVGAHVQTLFQRLDANRDGFITREESAAAKGQRGDRAAGLLQRRADRSPEQRAAKVGARFDRLDVNRDGALSREEFARAGAEREQRLAGADGQQRRLRRHGAGGKRGAMGMAGLGGHMFDMADANRDSRVSLAEATAAAFRHFDMADANRDGQVTREERMQARQQMRGARQSPGRRPG